MKGNNKNKANSNQKRPGGADFRNDPGFKYAKTQNNKNFSPKGNFRRKNP